MASLFGTFSIALQSLGATQGGVVALVVREGVMMAFVGLGFGLVGAVVGEFISSQRGLGHLIYTASSLYDLDTVWVGLFTLMIMGFVLYYVIDIIERTSLPWKQSNATHQVQV